MRPDFGPHFLIAMPEEATVGADSVSLDGLDAFAAWNDETPGLGAEELAELHSLILGVPVNYSILDNYQLVFTRDELHGPWLVRIPDDFVQGLASLDAEQLQSLGNRWLQASDNFRFRKTPGQWVQNLAFRLAMLAKRAIEHNKSLYWEPPSC